MSDTWNDIQALKLRQSSLRDKLQRRKKAREEIVQNLNTDAVNPVIDSRSNSPVTTLSVLPGCSAEGKESSVSLISVSNIAPGTSSEIKSDPEAEKKLLACLCDVALNLPIDSRAITLAVNRSLGRDVDHQVLENLLQKFDTQELITIEEGLAPDGQTCIIITSAEHTKLTAFSNELNGIIAEKGGEGSRKRKIDGNHLEESKAKVVPSSCRDGNQKAGESIESLLSMPSIREKENKRMGEEILDLLSKPTAKERSLAEKFRSQGGAQVKEFCPHGTTDECVKVNNSSKPCSKLHFKKIIQKHTDDSLGDCSFLNTCFHMDTCKYVHYEVDYSATPTQSDKWNRPEIEKDSVSPICRDDKAVATLYPPQWLQCDLRYFDMSILGKFAVVMADPPWDIHMELPYGTMSDDEMRKLNIPALQEEGLIFLWVTGRAMELGRECLKLWGYERCDEIIWVKTNQLQRIIRTGRTGHWLNHGKEHCLVGMKGNAAHINRGLDCDVIVAEVRATSHKPDEIYGIIERLSPGSRKIELFGRPHNVQPNWITLGNQLDGVRLLDPELVQGFSACYPDGNCMEPRPKT